MVSVVLLLVLMAVIAGGIAAISAIIVTWRRHDGVPVDRPTWLGPDPARIEDAVLALLNERRATAGCEPLEGSPEVIELARVHAFDMAVRHFGGETDPEGQGLAERRERLTPKLRGAARQWQALQIPEASKDADRIARDLIPIDGDLTRLVEEPSWNELGVGVAIEDGRCGACVVFAAREVEDPEAER